MLKKKPFRSEKYRRWIAGLPCCATSIEGSTQCAHIRHGLLGGVGLKPSDEWCVPLAWQSHDTQHRIGEKNFWALFGGVDKAKELAQELYRIYQEDDRDNKALIALERFRA